MSPYPHLHSALQRASMCLCSKLLIIQMINPCLSYFCSDFYNRQKNRVTLNPWRQRGARELRRERQGCKAEAAWGRGRLGQHQNVPVVSKAQD